MLNKKEIKSQVAAMKSIISLHEKMRNSYFWNPPANAAGRRNYEERYSDKYETNLFGTKIKLECNTSCSCKNIYYKGNFYINGEKKNLTSIKNIISAIETIL